MRIGVHVSIAGRIDEAIDRAADLSCETIQIFSRNPRGWKSKPLDKEEVEKFRRKRKKKDIYPILVHIPYLINLAAPKDRLWKLSIDSYIEDLKRTDLLEAEYFITHLGAHTGSGEEAGLNRFCEGLNKVISKARPKTMILLETCAGQGTSLGHKFEHIRYMLKKIDGNNIGVCLDTCHVYAAGYDIATKKGLDETLEKFDKVIGFKNLKAMHLNDVKGGLGSKLDRHEHIGKGKIKEAGMKRILTHPDLVHLPFVMETPKKAPGDDAMNIKTARKLAGLK
ncbi:MAG: deoxyribonuclease IV [Candidatus Omnitrophota bacterium]